MTGYTDAVNDLHWRHLMAAASIRMGTTGVKGAARRRVDRTGHLASYGNTLASRHLQIRDGVQQHTGVGVPGILK